MAVTHLRHITIMALLALIASSSLSIVGGKLAIARESSLTTSGTNSDFNGDGLGDLAIGAPFEDVNGKKKAGAVHVLYRSSSGLQTSSPADQLWHQDKHGVEDASEPVDLFGSALASGDFNGDGYSDLAIGAGAEDVSGVTDAGAVNVLYGSSLGLRTSTANDGTGRTDQIWQQNSPGIEDAAEPRETESDTPEEFGDSLAVNDFNGDGYDDLAIGVAGEGIGEQKDAGAVHILYGSSDGLRASSAGDGSGRSDQFWHQDIPGVEDTSVQHEAFGFSLAAGDFNKDGFSDLVIGVPNDGLEPAVGGTGAVNVLYGSATGLQTSSPADQFWNQDSTGVEGTAERVDSFGRAVAAGDFNGDGFDDLFIGSGADDESNLLYGSASGLQVSSPADVLFAMSVYGLESGDFNNDEYSDLAVSAPHEVVNGLTTAGFVQVFYGSENGLDPSDPEIWHQDIEGVDNPAEQGDMFGYALAANDFNGDEIQDLAIGARGEGIRSISSTGAVNVIFGSLDGLQATSPADQFWHQNSSGVDESSEVNINEEFGSSLS